MKKQLLLILMALLPMLASAYDALVDGIYYNLNTNAKTAEVTYKDNYFNSYSGSATIPASFIYLDETFSVTSIGQFAFYNCPGLTSVTIGNNVTSIGEGAFWGCSNMASIEFPNSVMCIGSNAFLETAWYNNQPYGLVYAGLVVHSYKGLMPNNTSVVLKENTKGIAASAFFHCSNLTSIDIPENVTNIGNNAFNGCTGLTSIKISDGVTSIGESAFSHCSGLTSVDIPNSIESIGERAFESCTCLTSIKIPNTVTIIETNTFAGCIGLTSIEIPTGVTTIGSGAFSNCSNLSSMSIPSTIQSIGWGAFQYCTSLTSIQIPNSLKSIGFYAFEGCTGLTSLLIPEGVTSIGTSAFSGCTSLTSISISGSVTSIGTSAFSGCTELEEITICQDNPTYDSRNNCNAIIETESNSLVIGCKNSTIPEGVLIIGISAFANCKGLSSLTLPSSIKHIQKYAFQGCSSLSSINIPDNVTEINEGVFSGCSSLTSIVIPQSVGSIGQSAFYNCSALTAVNIPNSVTFIGNGAFQGCSALISVTLSNSVTILNKSLFRDCTSLKAIDIPNGVTSIGAETFYNCRELYSLTIGSGVSYIGSSAFSGCTSLENITIKEGNPTFDSRDNCNAIIETATNKLIYGCNGSTIPNGITCIGNYAFSSCNGLTSIFIPESVISISDNSFDKCIGLASIAVDQSNTKYDSRDNCNAIIETATNRLILAGNNVSLPKSISSFGQYAFSGCTKLRLPDGLEDINSTMLSSCENLGYLIIPGSVKTIEETAFNRCFGLNTVIIEDELDPINFNFQTYNTNPKWFDFCPLDSVYLGRNINYNPTNQGHNLSPFRGNKSLHKAVLGDNVTIIPSGLFSGCDSLVSVLAPDVMDSIGNNAFYNCKLLSEFYIPSGIKSIGHSTFYNCKNLSSINIPNTLERIEDQAFYNCEGIKSLNIPNAVRRIGWSAFAGCSNLTDLIFEDGLNSLTIREDRGISAFQGCPIKSILLGRNIVNDSYNYIYSSLGSIKSSFNLKISKYVTELSGATFANCDSIITLTFEEGPDTLKLINDHNAFSAIMPFANTPIDSIYLGRIVIGFDNYYPTIQIIPFSGEGSSFSMRIGNNIVEIGDNAFSQWKIDSLYIPKSVNQIASTTFLGCNLLSSVIIEDGTEPLDFCEGGNFNYCPLDSVYLGRNMNYTSLSPFRYNREGLKHLSFGDNVTELGDVDFVGHVGLSSLTLPPYLRKIGSQTFYGCEGLTELSIPQSVVEIGDQAFDLCRNLTSVKIEDGTTTLAFIARQGYTVNTFTNSPLKKVYMGRNFSFPNLSPFSMQEDLDTIVIGEQVTTIANKSFTGCPKLKDVISYAKTVPTTGEVVFTPSYLPSATLHVPYELYNQYKVAPTWKDFGNIKNFEGLYNLTYMVDGEIYKDSVVEQNSPITPEAEPTKDYYTFSGWSEIPATMPDHDVIVTGAFYLYGDVNTDSEVDLLDVVDIARFVVGTPAETFMVNLADLNHDKTVNVTDAVVLVNEIAGDQNFVKAWGAPSSVSYDYDQCELQLLSAGQNALSLCLNGETDFTAFQFTMDLPEDVNISDLHLNDVRKDRHQFLYNKMEDGSYRVVVLSLTNNMFNRSEGELLKISLNAQVSNDISIRDIYFVTINGTEVAFEDIRFSGTTTQIKDLTSRNNTNNTLFDLQGRRRQSSQKGVNIINGKKIFIK